MNKKFSSVQYNFKGGDYIMDNTIENSIKTEQSESITSCHRTNTSNSSKYKDVEPLPESSRPRRDGPGGEDAK
jgi:hypothetical protein